MEDVNLAFRFKELITIQGCELKELSSEEITSEFNLTPKKHTKTSSGSLIKKMKEYPSSCMFQIITPNQILRLNATSAEEKINWLKIIDNTWSRLIENERSRINSKLVLDEPSFDLSLDTSHLSSLSGFLFEKIDKKWVKVFCKGSFF